MVLLSLLGRGPVAVAGTACPWDCGGDADANVGIVDFLAVLSQWGQVGTSCDFDGQGTDIVDFLELLANWGPCPATCFEIRDGVDGWETDPPEVQQFYDALNLTVTLISGLPFSSLYDMTVAEVVAVTAPRVAIAQQCGIVSAIDAAALVQTLQDADTLAGGLTIRAISVAVAGDNPALDTVLTDLAALGLRSPLPVADVAEATARNVAIDALILEAGGLDFKDLYTLPKVLGSPEDVAIMAAGFFGLCGPSEPASNNRCCNETMVCVTSTLFCVRVTISNFCTKASNNCN